MTGAVVVFGSINMDLVARVPRLPMPGETLAGRSFSTVPGGKGANQAVACARLGAPTRMVGRVGDDVFGAALLDSLRGYGVETVSIAVSHGSSGIAVINVDDRAENNIIIIAGANGVFGAEDVMRFLGRKLHGNFKGELRSDLKHRPQGQRVKETMRIVADPILGHWNYRAIPATT